MSVKYIMKFQCVTLMYNNNNAHDYIIASGCSMHNDIAADDSDSNSCM